MYCTRPPHAPVATIFEISRYMHRRNELLIRLLNALRQSTNSFALFGAHQSANLLTGRSVVRTPPLPLDFPCLGLGNLAVSQPSCFIRVAWQLGTERVLQLNDIVSTPPHPSATIYSSPLRFVDAPRKSTVIFSQWLCSREGLNENCHSLYATTRWSSNKPREF
ncbi:hypothetical protein CSKR_101305 [Clonorchis sinensis]|uniref:Uncharacterized protein n=1 Tax=Clonorchis sinensis TaxID=79923 RepID=A0A3R7G567_CLOSI|nr:hypothetical protein CSKR_101305 [Clonorchis sinensis]